MLKKAFKSLLTLGFMSLILFFSCKKESNLESKDSLDVRFPNNLVGTLVFGVITDENNTPIAGATVSLNSETTMTDQYGGFSGVGIAVTEKTVLKVNYNGYFQSIHLLDLVGKKVHKVEIKLQKKKLVGSFDASSGATTEIDGGDSEASVAFPAGGYATLSGRPYAGNVNVYARFANIASPNFIQTVPGTMTAVDNNGVLSNLRTFGMMEVLLTDDIGNPLQLKNSTATLTMPIASSQTSTAPESIPLWYLDEKTAIWKQEGAATKQGDKYVGTVSHFTWWNCDISQPASERAAIKGRTVIQTHDGIAPVQGVDVYSELGGSGSTEADGTFGYTSVASVTSGVPLTIRFSKPYTNCISQTITVNIPALSVGQVYDMGDIDVSSLLQDAKTFTGKVYLCNNTPAGELIQVRAYNIDNIYLGGTSTNTNSEFTMVTCGAISKLLITHISGESKILINPSQGNLGNIILECPNVPFDNEFTINGDGFNNLKIVDPNLDLPIVSDSTGFDYYRVDRWISSVNYKFVFKNSNVNNDWGIDTNTYWWGITGLTLTIRESNSNNNYKFYNPVSGTTVITSNTATEIQGTYSGVVKNTQTNELATISNGRFRARKP